MSDTDLLHIHLVSDSTGQTVSSVARAVLALFPEHPHEEHHWILIHGERQMERVLRGIREAPGPVLFTLLNADLRSLLEAGTRDLPWPCISVLDAVLSRLTARLGAPEISRPGQQHAMDEQYFRRIEAMHFAVEMDDGRNHSRLHEADVILVGVSRSSKTPTSLYLANYGLRVANIPFVPDLPLPPFLEESLTAPPLVVGLTKDARALGEIRRTRLRSLSGGGGDGDGAVAADASRLEGYADHDEIVKELRAAKRLFTSRGWPVVDVTRRSIEETAAEILTLHEGVSAGRGR
ncbi:MAG: kinase/pyrophosphorylase [Alphaproteobacteria bacterium]|nr:kinase/pyrophosphorylase [Alphaproteobacteria bacterium]MDA7983675.1 kinase/pyrophosphorylase [Alphaproteobacteria bacterium]MDA7985019.1 kinase/pyrophosphorylase [Alphaproteobacteria bacterium]MDA7987836.1 kinase/pyrophosphorylase [Alphaproteobacteria bacterium]MDA7989210.1 kinase/pyrophosphorylase [Alphaproteobacteria bacterium]